MGIPFSIPWDTCAKKVYDWLQEQGAYTHNLERNLGDLENAMVDLKAKRDDLKRRVTIEEDRGRERLAEIQVWLTRVEAIEKEVNDILIARDVELGRLCFYGFCSNTLTSSNEYGKKVFLKLGEVEELKRNGGFQVVAEQAPTQEVEQIPPPQIIVGQETMFDKAWNHLMEDEVGLMGMYGMGGVGKTTLLTQLNNNFSNERCGFDFVIWVVVSKELQVGKIQDGIAEKLGLRREEGWNGKNESQKATHLFNFLRKKKFVLFLDDMWKEVDLVKIGVPFPTTENGCKVAFTTRSKDVCGRMRVQDSMEVQCLTEKDAFDLFKYNVGQRTLGSHPEIPDLAQKVAKECCGLPLALDVIGRTMSCKTTVQEWHHALDVLKSYASDFPDMNDKILPLLKYSYDDLKEEQVKLCLLYCSLFPEDYEIPKDTLIEYLIGEGIIDGSKGIETAEYEGYDIIGSLVRASLLMEAGTYVVRMHDVVREMALWIATDLGKEKEAFIVHAGVGFIKMPKVENWNVVRRMSLMKNNIEYLVGSPKCQNLTTSLWRDAKLKNISSEFFNFMPKLVVLDLSDNKSLSELPDGISELVSLQYLNLSNTGIKELPKGLLELKKLIHLDLESTKELKSIAGISSLHNLKVLKLFGSRVLLDLSIVEELETLKQLEILTFGIGGAPSRVENFLSSHRLTSCTQALSIKDVYLESSGITLPSNVGKLREFVVYDCKISEICINKKTVSPLQNPRDQCFLSLSEVRIVSCKGLKELTLLMFAPNLKNLKISYARELEDIIKKEKACEDGELGIVPFPKLISLWLLGLDKLKNIYWNPLPFPCLEEIEIENCPNLKKLPLDSKSGKQGAKRLSIKYEPEEWMEDIEWEDEATKTRFLSSCQYIGGY